MRILIVNPNTSRATNARIGAIAAPLFREPDVFEVVSAPSGIELIETVAQSNATVPAVLSVVEQRHEGVDAIVIAAFSDPGLAQAREAASCPVFAISEAAMTTAARMADRFAVITLGAELRGAVEANAAAYGVAGQLTEVRILPWTVARVSADPPFYREAFAEACAQAVAEDGAGAVIIGGGPLSGIADAIAGDLPVPVLDGVRCAVTMAWRRSIPPGDRDARDREGTGCIRPLARTFLRSPRRHSRLLRRRRELRAWSHRRLGRRAQA